MTEYYNKTIDRYSHFDRMDTDSLKAFLRQDSMLPDNEATDIEAIIYIADLIERREKLEVSKIIDVDALWKSFCENYYPIDNEDIKFIVYTANGVENRIIHNTVRSTATWSTENFEWSIAGAAAVDEMMKMIDSVYKVAE